MARTTYRPATPDELVAQREKMLLLADLQRQMRTGLLAAREANGWRMSDLANALGDDMDWKRARAALEGHNAVCGGSILTAVAKFLAASEHSSLDTSFEKQVQNAVDGMSDRIKGTSLFSEDTINLMYDLQIAFAHVVNRFNHERFAALFGDHADIVGRLLVNAKEGLAAVQDDPVLYKAISDILNTSDWNEKVDSAHNEYVRSMHAKARELNASVAILQTQSGSSLREIARELGMSSSTITNATHEDSVFKVSVQKLDALIESIAAMLTGCAVPTGKASTASKPPKKRRNRKGAGGSKHAPGKEVRSVEEAEPPEEPDAAAFVTAPGIASIVHVLGMLAQRAGDRSPLDVPGALTAKTFNPTDEPLSKEWVALTTMVLQVALGMLNECTHARTSKAGKVQKRQLTAAVAELYHAIGTHLHDNPDSLPELLEIYDGQRGSLASALGIPRKTTRGRTGRKKRSKTPGRS